MYFGSQNLLLISINIKDFRMITIQCDSDDIRAQVCHKGRYDLLLKLIEAGHQKETLLFNKGLHGVVKLITLNDNSVDSEKLLKNITDEGGISAAAISSETTLGIHNSSLFSLLNSSSKEFIITSMTIKFVTKSNPNLYQLQFEMLSYKITSKNKQKDLEIEEQIRLEFFDNSQLSFDEKIDTSKKSTMQNRNAFYASPGQQALENSDAQLDDGWSCNIL